MDLNNRNRLGSVRLSMHGRDLTSRKDTRNPNHDHPSVDRRSGFHHPTYPHAGPHTRGGAAHSHRAEPVGAPQSGAQCPNLEPKLRYSEIGKLVKPFKGLTKCRRFKTGGSLGRRVNVAACPSSDGSARGRARRGEVRWPETGVREVEIPRPSCSSRVQVGCACSRGLQASTRERERAASRERLSHPRPRAAHPL
jgi:hypothetical protein